MKYISYLVLIIMAISCNSEKKIIYPETKKVDTIDTYFGIKVPDPYRWLENDTAPEVKAWVENQNKVTFDYLKAIPYRDKIKERITKLFNYEKRSTPFKEGNLYFYYKNDGLQNQSVLYTTPDINQPGNILLDPNNLSSDGTVALNSIAISPDGKILAFAIAKAGSDWNEIYFKEIKSGKMLPDTLHWVKFSGIAWFNNGIYYSGYSQPEKGKELSQSNKFHKLFYHKLGTPQSQDVIVMEKPSEPFQNFFANNTSDNQILCIYEEKAGELGNALHIINLNNTKPIIQTLIADFKYQYSVIDHKDNFIYLKTNENANNYKVIRINMNQLHQTETIIPETNDVINDVNISKNNIVVTYMHNAHSILKVFDLQGKFLYEIELPCIGTVNSFNTDIDDDIAFYDFTSFNYPTTIFKINLKTQASEIWFKPQIDFNESDYEVKQVFYESKDKTKIPMFIVHKKGIALNGKNPTLLYGYGGFNISLTPSFSTTRLVWLEQGGVLAIANLRGGGEYGEKWHLAGTKLKKQNVFDDFIAAAEYLIAQKYTSPDYLAIQGGSNGGLLVGAVTNQRPELFKVALPAVGVMDMLRFHKFTIGWSWTTDYGSSDNKEEFEALYQYSPIHNIKENTNYPAILVTTADHDDRVVPAHSFKYIATLQEKCKGKNPVLIRIETQAGHGGGKPTAKIIEETADIYAFTFFNMGIEPK
ncbi:MAG: S9 family peptidase [Bacteroidales bacterium]|nr:S9 family peptidase [Bacteroidales bacterium]